MIGLVSVVGMLVLNGVSVKNAPANVSVDTGTTNTLSIDGGVDNHRENLRKEMEEFTVRLQSQINKKVVLNSILFFLAKDGIDFAVCNFDVEGNGPFAYLFIYKEGAWTFFPGQFDLDTKN